jgi:hypothetical protein
MKVTDDQYGLEQFILADLSEKRQRGREQEVFLTYKHILQRLGSNATETAQARQWAEDFVHAHLLVSSPRDDGIWFTAIFE